MSQFTNSIIAFRVFVRKIEEIQRISDLIRNNDVIMPRTHKFSVIVDIPLASFNLRMRYFDREIIEKYRKGHP